VTGDLEFGVAPAVSLELAFGLVGFLAVEFDDEVPVGPVAVDEFAATMTLVRGWGRRASRTSSRKRRSSFDWVQGVVTEFAEHVQERLESVAAAVSRVCPTAQTPRLRRCSCADVTRRSIWWREYPIASSYRVATTLCCLTASAASSCSRDESKPSYARIGFITSERGRPNVTGG
jgi:hypothetical protein